MVFTANSALPLEDGKYADDILCRMPHRLKKSLVSLAVNSGPPSLETSIGTTNVTKIRGRNNGRSSVKSGRNTI